MSFAEARLSPLERPRRSPVVRLSPTLMIDLSRNRVGSPQPTVREFKSPSLFSVRPGCSAFEARNLCRAHGIHHVPVIESGDLLGMVCTCDLWKSHPEDRVYELMSRRVISIEAGAPVSRAAKTMLETGVGCLPVIDGGRVCGVVTRENLARAGIPLESSGGICTSCRSHRHVPHRGLRTEVRWCRECLERATPPRTDDEMLYFELGAGG